MHPEAALIEAKKAHKGRRAAVKNGFWSNMRGKDRMAPAHYGKKRSHAWYAGYDAFSGYAPGQMGTVLGTREVKGGFAVDVELSPSGADLARGVTVKGKKRKRKRWQDLRAELQDALDGRRDGMVNSFPVTGRGIDWALTEAQNQLTALRPKARNVEANHTDQVLLYLNEVRLRIKAAEAVLEIER